MENQSNSWSLCCTQNKTKCQCLFWTKIKNTMIMDMFSFMMSIFHFSMFSGMLVGFVLVWFGFWQKQMANDYTTGYIYSNKLNMPGSFCKIEMDGTKLPIFILCSSFTHWPHSNCLLGFFSSLFQLSNSSMVQSCCMYQSSLFNNIDDSIL